MIIASDSDIQTFLEATLATRQFEIHPLAGDASARRYYRIITGEESWVLMLWEPFIDDGTYPFLSVRAHFEKHGVSVPRVLGMSPEKGFVLLEDLGDLTLERKFWESQNQEHCLPYYKSTLDELIKIHYDCSADRTQNCVAFDVQFDTAKLLWEMNYGREHLLEGLCEIRLSESMRKDLERTFVDICETLHKEPKFIAHRDYHSRNVMIKHGRVRVIDFQDARMGTIQYDLVSLLRDSYVALNDDSVGALLSYYLESRLEKSKSLGLNLPTLSREQFDHIFEIQTIQRCFKACGSFASFYMLRKDTRYLKYLTPTLKTVRRSLEPFAKYRPFLQILEDHGVFDRTFDAE
ncbi:MAG: phosphotransferase [Bdellovibrionales bacterium]|nr:phosphotransferase [Bdellovibrionales bacterium]